MPSPNQLLLLPQFQKFINACKKGKRTKYAGRKLASGTITQYQCVKKLLEEYERKHTFVYILLVAKPSPSIMKKEKKYWSQFYLSFLQFLYKDKCYLDNYISGVLKIMQTFFNYLANEKQYPISRYYKQFKINVPAFTPLILSPSQLQYLIFDKSFERSLPIHLQRTKAIFVFGCTVALRYSDLMQLRQEHFVQTSTENYLLLHTKKTGTEVRLPLPEYLIVIIRQYQKQSGKYLLPRLSATNLNLHVKQMCKLAGWTYTLPKTRYRQGKPITITNEQNQPLHFYEQVTTHTMRRTAITTLLTLGVPEQVVRRISGHAPNSKEFYRYVVIAQDYLNQHVLKAYDKLVIGD